MPDRSLDEFLGGDEADADEGADDDEADANRAPEPVPESDAPESDAPESDASESESDAPESDDVERVTPAVATARWAPSGQRCAECGAEANRLWRADEADEASPFVCADCREW